MKFSISPSESLLAAVVIAGLGIAAWQAFGGGGAKPVDVKVPTLSSVALSGEVAFNTVCAQCHGEHGTGTKLGPPLLNDIYNPGHHPDESFRAAVRQGVRQHHWKFGDMPPLPQVSNATVAEIVRYMRELQQANGIFYRAHQM